MIIGNDGIRPHHETRPQTCMTPSVQPIIHSKIWLGLQLGLSSSHGATTPTNNYKEVPTASKVAVGNHRRWLHYRVTTIMRLPSLYILPCTSYLYTLISVLLLFIPISTHQRTAEEVQSLLAQSEEMLSQCHFASSELRDRAWDLNSLHNNFESRLRVRGKVLNDTVAFYRSADEVHVCIQVYVHVHILWSIHLELYKKCVGCIFALVSNLLVQMAPCDYRAINHDTTAQNTYNQLYMHMMYMYALVCPSFSCQCLLL